MESNKGFSNEAATRRAIKREVDLLEFLADLNLPDWENIIEIDIDKLIAQLPGSKK